MQRFFNGVVFVEKLTVIKNGLKLSMNGPKGREKLEIKGEYPSTLFSGALFSNLGVMHLVAPYLPEIIETNFRLTRHWTGLIDSMYAFSLKSHPKFRHTSESFYFESDNVDLRRYKVEKLFPDFRKGPERAVVAYSAGKDSMWNMWWAQEKYGEENVMALHISGLNKGNADGETAYSKLQAEKLGFKNFEILHLINSSRNSGFQTMRSRDMFLAGLIVPYAILFGASSIITEGFAETGEDEPFSGQEKNMNYFNFMLKECGIPVRVLWKNKEEMDIVKDLITNKPGWLPYVHNCFSPANYKAYIRKSWPKRAPTLRLYDSQCGSCVKCRIINLARLFYGNENISEQDAQYFLKNTAGWIREKMPTHADMIEGSFLREFKRAAEKYGIKTAA